MKKAWLKYLNVILIVFFLLVLTKPFSISAEEDYSDYLIGYNYRIIDYDVNTVSSFNMNNITASGTLDTNGVSGNVISMGEGTLSNGRNYYSTGLAGGSMRIKGDIDLNFSGSLSSTNTRSYIRVIEVDLLFNKSYNGSFLLDIYKGTADYVFTNFVYCNSDKVTISFIDDSSSTMTNTPYYEFEMSYIDLTPNIDLSDLYNELIDINQHTYDLTQLRQYNIPLDSYPFNLYFFTRGYPLFTKTNTNFYFENYPIFDLPANTQVYDKYISSYAPDFRHTLTFIVATSINGSSINQIYQNFNIDQNVNEISYYEYIDLFTFNDINGNDWTMYVYRFDVSAKQTNSFKLTTTKRSLFIPIYCNYKSNIQYTQTDFALSWHLKNSYLENIDKIANGNNISNNSVTNADQTNQQAASVFTQEETIVNNAETSLNQNLQTLDVANKNNNLFGNSKFIASASWVKDQFDFFTNNNAFGYLITFSLVIGISLVIIGKLRG